MRHPGNTPGLPAVFRPKSSKIWTLAENHKLFSVRAVAEMYIRAFCVTAVFYQLIQYLGCIVQYSKEQLSEYHNFTSCPGCSQESTFALSASLLHSCFPLPDHLSVCQPLAPKHLQR